MVPKPLKWPLHAPISGETRRTHSHVDVFAAPGSEVYWTDLFHWGRNVIHSCPRFGAVDILL